MIANTNIPKLRFPEFEGEWEELRFGETLKFIKSGKTKHSEYGIYPVYGSTGVLGFCDKKEFDEPLILIARVGANAGQINFTSEACGVTDNTLVVSLDKGYIDAFIICLLRKINLNKYIFGSGQPLITGGLLKSIKSFYPKLPEQQKIASFLSSVDDKIGQLQRKKAALEAYKKGMMQQLFSQQTRFKDNQGNNFPDWEEKKLGEVADIIGGGTPETIKEEYWHGEINWFTPTEIKTKYLSHSKRKISDLGLKKSSAKMLPTGTLLLSTRATVGDVGIATKECSTNQGFQSWVMCNDNYNEFWYYWIIRNKKEFIRKSSGSTFIEISKTEVQKIKALAPHPAEQQKIADFLTALDRKIDLVAQELTQAKTFKKGLLQQMFV